MTVIAAVSHKGGAGRSVTLANVAFQLNQHGRGNICIVDLDLASPTMGSIFGIKGLEGGEDKIGGPHAPRSIYDLIAYKDHETPVLPASSCYIDIREKASPPLRDLIKPDPRLIFLPGFRGVGDWADKISRLSVRLFRIIDALQDAGFKYILLDVRSGSSDVLDALSKLHEQKGIIDLVLVHIKWTPQHVEGLDTLLAHRRMKGFPQNIVKIVRTAYWDPAVLEDQGVQKDLAKKINSDLESRIGRIKLDGVEIAHNNKEQVIATIPDNPMLRIREGIIQDAEDSCYQAFQSLAYRIQKLRS